MQALHSEGLLCCIAKVSVYMQGLASLIFWTITLVVVGKYVSTLLA